MHSDIRSLLEVQTLDQEILELNAQLAKYPAIWEEVKSKLAKKKKALEQAQNNKERHEKERRRVEQKLRLFSDDLRRYQTQQTTVKTPREYEAISSQIDATKKKISQAEEQGLALIEKDQELAEELKQAEEEVQKEEEFYKEEKERIREQFNEKKGRVEELKKERNKIADKIKRDVLSAYESIYKRYPGSALVPVRSNSCTGCHWQLLPNLLVQVHREEGITYCPNCGRILTEDEDFEPAETEAS